MGGQGRRGCLNAAWWELRTVSNKFDTLDDDRNVENREASQACSRAVDGGARRPGYGDDTIDCVRSIHARTTVLGATESLGRERHAATSCLVDYTLHCFKRAGERKVRKEANGYCQPCGAN